MFHLPLQGKERLMWELQGERGVEMARCQALQPLMAYIQYSLNRTPIPPIKPQFSILSLQKVTLYWLAIDR